MQRQRLAGRTGDWSAVALAFVISLPTTLIRPWADWTPLWSWPVLVSATGSLCLLMRRRWPEVPLTAGYVVIVLTHSDSLMSFALYAMGRYRSLRITLCWVAGSFLVRQLFFDYLHSCIAPFADWETGLLTIRASLVAVVAPAAAGIVVRNYRISELVASFQAQLRYDDVRRETLKEAESKAEKKRRRLARDAHDHIGHELTLMALQANLLAARATDETMRNAGDALVGRAQDAIEQLHAIVIALKEPGEHRGDARPGRKIEDLVERSRSHGVDVRLVERGYSKHLPLPPAVAELCYRVVLEGLTNAVKHAPGSAVTVTVQRNEARVWVGVRNEAPGTAPAASTLPSGGHGLGGLEELVSYLGGELAHGRTADGGFELRAKLPLASSSDGRGGLSTAAPGEHGDS
ncbi:sensor histidine kinase [Streptomyces sp. NBC_01304]|uniref:sensor histidine kinase n=1 Tax=Streptomyces sp. NBC_01304 TaxID=2903818 RepID=UPI002E10E305|nr:histidine kinase [Streptomyces sp. NBC_01304]